MNDSKPRHVERSPGTVGGWCRMLAVRPVPVLEETIAELRTLREDEDDVDARMLAFIVDRDPLMQLRVFSHLAAQRGHRAGAEVTTIERAIVMLGVPPFFSMVENAGSAEAWLSDKPHAFEFLVDVIGRARRAAAFAREFAVWRNDVAAVELMLAAQLHGCAEMLLWCHAPDLCARIHARLAADPTLRSTAAQRMELGVPLLEIQLAMATEWRLPQLLASMMDDRHADLPAVQNVALAVNLARHSAAGWANAALPDDVRAVARLLSASEAQVRSMIGAPDPASVAA